MKPLSEDLASKLVLAALQSQALRLVGNTNPTVPSSERAAEADAAYLLKLMHALTAPPAG